MDRGDWDLVDAAQERARQKVRKKNDAFRERLRQRQHQHQAQRRERLKLKMATWAAVAAWGVAAVQYLR